MQRSVVFAIEFVYINPATPGDRATVIVQLRITER